MSGDHGLTVNKHRRRTPGYVRANPLIEFVNLADNRGPDRRRSGPYPELISSCYIKALRSSEVGSRFGAYSQPRPLDELLLQQPHRGHHTHPVDIDRALAGEYSAEPATLRLRSVPMPMWSSARTGMFASMAQTTTSCSFNLRAVQQ